MDGGPGADSWETVDRKVSKKSKKKVEGEEDGSWSQVSNDKRKKEFSGTRGGRGTEGRGGERRDGGDRRGDGGDRRGDRGKPPRGGSNQRNTLPRRPGGRDRDGYGSAAGGPGAGQFSRSTPSPGRSNAQTPQTQGKPGPPPPQDNIPSKPSWANLAGKTGGTEGIQKPALPDVTKPSLKPSPPVPEKASAAWTSKPPLESTSFIEKAPDVFQTTSPDTELEKDKAPTPEPQDPSPTNELNKPTEVKAAISEISASLPSKKLITLNPAAPEFNFESAKLKVKSEPVLTLNPAAPPFTLYPGKDKDVLESPATAALVVNKDDECNGNIVALDANENIEVSKPASLITPVSLSPPVDKTPEVEIDPVKSPSLDASKTTPVPSSATESVPTLTSPVSIKPVDPETRHYGRDALLQLQQHPLSLVKPERLPALDIVLDSPLRSSNSAPQLGETPQFHQFARTLPSKRDSVRKPSKIISLSREPVKLHKSENAWAPAVKSQTEQDEMNVLSKSVLSILNKLTPQMFDVLVEKFKKLDIDTEEKLIMCMEQVFEKAVDEPSFSSAYARMCRELSRKAVTKDTQSDENFRQILLDRCQKEFQADYISEEQRKKYEDDLNNATTEDDKKKIKGEFETLELKMRRRSLGNIRFISELYNLKMLPGKIMHEIVRKLLEAVDEESLESLCRLLTTSGSNMEKETATIPEERRHLYDFDNYFSKIEKIVGNKKVSSRVRFLLQDVVDLRKNNWVSRRVDTGPKTIRQIHKEAELEALKIKLADQNLSSPVARRSEDRNRRKTEFRPPRAQQDEGWSAVPLKAQRASDVMDPERLRNIKKVDASSIKLGPDSGRGFSSWAGGSAGPQTPSVHSGNRFQMLEDSESMPAPQVHYSGRASEPIRTSYDRSLSRGRTQYGKPSSQVSSRSNSVDRSASLRGSAATDEEELKTKFRTLLDEYISNCDFNETLVSICENFHSSNIDFLVEVCFDYGLEKKEKDRLKCGDLLSGLIEKECLQISQLCTGLGRILEIAADIILDVPKFWELTADILACVLVKRSCFDRVMENSCKYVTNQKLRENFIETVLGSIKRMNEDSFSLFISQHKEALEKLLGLDLASFLTDKQLLVIVSKPLQNGSRHEDLYRQLSDVLNKKVPENDELSSIDKILCDKVIEKDVLRIVVTAVIESVVDGVAGTQCSLRMEGLKARAPILKKYLDADKDRELNALYAIQSLVHGLQHPNKLLHQILEALYDQDCISEDALLDWEKSEDPEEQEGKGVALKSCTQFFEWLKTADEEQEEMDMIETVVESK